MAARTEKVSDLIERVTYHRVYPDGHDIEDGIYEVSLDGVVLGEVRKGWSRFGGKGWLTKHDGSSTDSTRREAVFYALRRVFARDETWDGKEVDAPAPKKTETSPWRDGDWKEIQHLAALGEEARLRRLAREAEAKADAKFLGEQTVRNNGEGPLFEIFKATGYKCDGCKSTQLIKADETLEGDFDHNAHCPNQDSPYREDFTLTDSGFFFETEDGDYVSEGFLTAYAAYTDAAAYDIDAQAAHGDHLADLAKEGGY
jgi:hypothetical protein